MKNYKMMEIQKVTKLLSKYRGSIMGFAILWILMFHSGVEYGSFLNFFRNNGFGGVDIFLFLSGFGIYFSLEKDNRPMQFIIRRIKRIFPSYFVTLVIYFVINASRIINSTNLKTFFIRFLANLFMISYLKQWADTFNWYIFCICYFYFLSPFLYRIIKKNGYAGISGLLLVAIIGNIYGMRYFGFAEFMIKRIFIYLLGMVFAYLSRQYPEQKVPVHMFVIVSILAIISLYWKQSFYTFIFITPGLCILLSLLFDSVLSKVKGLFTLFGDASFEMYLVNVTFSKYFAGKTAQIIGWRKMTNVVALIITVIVGFVFHYLISTVKSLKLSKMKNR